MKIAILNGRVIDPANQLDEKTDIAIENGRIVQVGKLPAGFVPDKKIDALGQWVIPGLVDISARHSQAALQRGITTICIPPDSTHIEPKSGETLPHLYSIGPLTENLAGNAMSDLTDLANTGCVGFSNGQHAIHDLRMLKHCYDYAASFDLLVVIQPQDHALAKGGVAHEGIMATRLGLPGIPETAETIAIAQHLLLIQQSGIRAHFTGLSSAHSVQLIREAKDQGLPVTADVFMHALHLTEMDLSDFDSNCHLYPPLRSVRDQGGLLAGVADQTIDAICSDHRPLEAIAKLAPFGDTVPGLSAIDTFLSLGLHLEKLKKIEAANLIGALTHRPAKIFNLPAGTLSVGSAADICILNPDQYWRVSDETLLSKGKNTPFKDWELPGTIKATLKEGVLVYEA